MYAVIKTGGKQYKVTQGDTLEVEHLVAKDGTASFTPVLIVDDGGETIYGAKALKEYVVSAKVLGDAKGDKVTVFKYRPKSGYASKSGHRQLYSLIEITGIGSKGQKSSKAETKTQPEPEPVKEAKTDEDKAEG